MRFLQAATQVREFYTKGLDILLPPRCLVTGETVEAQGMIAPQAWASLNFVADPICACCGIPFEFEMEKGALCAGCASHYPPFSSARAALVYDDASKEMILRFKHGDQLHGVHTFLPWMKRAGAEMLGEADMLVPVPLHHARLLKRRYNQAAVIARALGKSCGMQCVPDALLRKRHTQTQGHLSYKDRQKNVKNAFVMNPRYGEMFRDKKIVLIDDVYTTGATVKECAKALGKGGAGRVDVLTLARVVRR